MGRMSSEAAPFGGMKQSGIRREGSRHMLEDYVEVKYFAWAASEASPLPPNCVCCYPSASLPTERPRSNAGISSTGTAFPIR